jgi:predicted permease
VRWLIVRLAPRRWREAIEGDLEESAPKANGARRVWILVHFALIALGLRLAQVSDLVPRPMRVPLLRWSAEAISDARYGLRRWAARPGFTAAAVATIALGIGTTSSLFSVVDGILLKPLPYPNSDRLVTINRTYPDWRKDPILVSSWNRISLAWPEFFYVRERSRTIEAFAVISTRLAILDGSAAREHRVAVISASFLPMLGITPDLGSGFAPGADLEDPGTLLISHAVWQTQFGADPSIVGKTIPIRGGSRTVAGVLPRSFVWGPLNRQYDFWYPLSAVPVKERADNNRYLDAFARMRPGVGIAEVTDEMSVLLNETFRYKSATAAVATPILERQLQRVRTPLMLLLAGSVLLLVIACANVAGLLTGDAASRSGEMEVRASLGATRWRVLRQVFIEALVLAIAGSAVGLLCSIWGVRGLVMLAPPDMPRIAEVSVGWRVAAIAMLAAAATAVLFAVLPAVMLNRERMTARMSSVRTVTARRATAVLAAVEIAVGVALLAGAGLFAQSLYRLERVDAGFDRTNLLTLRAGLPASPDSDMARATRYFEAAQAAIRSMPGVADVAITSNLAFVSGRASTTISVPNRESGAAVPFEAQRRFVSPEYFRTLRIEMLRGRTFERTDTTNTPAVTVVSRAMERRLWPDGAVGRTFTYAAKEHTIVGVVDDVRDQALDSEPQATFYLSTTQRPAWSIMHILVRTAGEPASLVGPVREALTALDPDVPVEDVTTMDAIVFRATDDERYRTVLMGVFAGAAAVLAAVGLYSTLTRRVVERRREIGVRMALGARPGQVRRLFLFEGIYLAAAGLVLGVPLALLLGRAASALLFGISPADGATLAGVVLVVGTLAVLATFIPSIRASRLDPISALRLE